MSRYSGEGLRLTLADPCEGGDGMCPNDATMTVVDRHSKPWRVCVNHARYFIDAPKSEAETKNG